MVKKKKKGKSNKDNKGSQNDKTPPSFLRACLHVSKVNRKSKSVVFNYGTCAQRVQMEIGMFSLRTETKDY